MKMDEDIKTFYRMHCRLDVDICKQIPPQLFEEGNLKNLEIKLENGFQRLESFIEKNTIPAATYIEGELSSSAPSLTIYAYGLVISSKKPVGWANKKFQTKESGIIANLGQIVKDENLVNEARMLGINLETSQLAEIILTGRLFSAGFMPEFLQQNPLYLSRGIIGKKKAMEKVDFSSYLH